MKFKFNLQKSYLAALAIGVVFFAAYSFLLWNNNQPIFSWPDEMSNYYFVNNFITHGNFKSVEPLNILVGDLIHPRSINVFQHNLVPTGFLGLPLIYGLIGKLFGLKMTLLLTPLLAVIGAWFFYKLIADIFDVKVGRLSGLLLLLQPAYFYYASFTMLPNVAFVSLLIISLYFFNRSLHHNSSFIIHPSTFDIRSSQLNSFLAGLFFSLSLIIRPSEFIWLGCLLAFFLIVLIRSKQYLKALLSVLPIILIVGIYFYYNQQTYGALFATGYQSLAEGSTVIASSSIWQRIFGVILPFGFLPMQILKTTAKYLFLFHWWYWVLAFLGILITFLYKNNKKVFVYTILGVLISAFLIIFYGSWQIFDQFILNIANLGVSFHRYWLPILIFIIPFAAVAIQAVLDLPVKFKKYIYAGLIILVIFLDIRAVYFTGNDNLLLIKQSIEGNVEMGREVLAKTPANAVIITERGDKIIFPQRKVIGQFDLDKLEPLKQLPANTPVFLMAYDGQFNLENAKNILVKQGFTINNPQALSHDFTLYEIK